MTYEFFPEARAELFEAVLYYEKKGSRFRAAIAERGFFSYPDHPDRAVYLAGAIWRIQAF